MFILLSLQIKFMKNLGWLSKLFGRKKKVKEGKKEEETFSLIPRWELDPKKEEGMIDSLAKQVNRMGMQAPAVLFLETVKPLSEVGGHLAIFSGIPLFLEFFGVRGYDWTLLFSKEENIERLLKKIEKSVQ